MERDRFSNTFRSLERFSEGPPSDLLASRFDETDLYLPDDTYRNWAKEALMDYSRDPIPAPGDEPKSSRRSAVEALNLRLNGHRGNAADPANPEAFLGDLSKEREVSVDGTPSLRGLAAAGKFRAERYQLFNEEGPQATVSSSLGPRAEYEVRQAAIARTAQARRFDDSRVAKLGRRAGVPGDARHAAAKAGTSEEAFDDAGPHLEARYEAGQFVRGQYGPVAAENRGRFAVADDRVAAQDNVSKTQRAASWSAGYMAKAEEDAEWRDAAAIKNVAAAQATIALNLLAGRLNSATAVDWKDTETFRPTSYRGNIGDWRRAADSAVAAGEWTDAKTLRPAKAGLPETAVGMEARQAALDTEWAEEQVFRAKNMMSAPADPMRGRDFAVPGSAETFDESLHRTSFGKSATPQEHRARVVAREQAEQQVAWLASGEYRPGRQANPAAGWAREAVISARQGENDDAEEAAARPGRPGQEARPIVAHQAATFGENIAEGFVEAAMGPRGVGKGEANVKTRVLGSRVARAAAARGFEAAREV